MASDRPLIVETMDRARLLAPDQRIRILAGSYLLEPFRRVLPDLPVECLLLEPQARGTGPVLAWAAWLLHQQDPDAVLVSLHSDHMIRHTDAFRDLLGEAAALARREDMLVTIAVNPTRPETGYGYIERGEALRHEGTAEAYRVVQFIEKPDEVTAINYIRAGRLWNSGIFVWTARRFLEEVRSHAPEIGDLLPLLKQGKTEEFFETVPVTTVDVAVLERSERVATMTATFEWDDVGSWESLFRTLETDLNGNIGVGEAYSIDSLDTLVYGADEPVVVFGVDNLVIVRTPEATLITTREKAPHLKEALDQLPSHVRGTESK
ncbi:MAG: mannose-1-phosphate guanylyltransferase [Gemmatimonadota bacterium]|nr:MAG: mannose-1-phosphate guanylyltransferase [Gemmatimonadota bacterium]